VSDIPTYSSLSVSLSLSLSRTSDTIPATWHYHRVPQIFPLTPFALFREHDKSLTILPWLRAVRPGNPGSITRRDKGLALLQCPDLLWGTPNLFTFPVGKLARRQADFSSPSGA
jgi:hypothetical protein